MKPLMLLLALLAIGCGAPPHVSLNDVGGLLDPSIDDSDGRLVAALRESTRHCARRRCSVTPVLAVVYPTGRDDEAPQAVSLTDVSKATAYQFGGLTVYDGRIAEPHIRYLSYRDPNGEVVCQGYYSFSGFGRTAEAKLRCFDNGLEVTGLIRTIGRQPVGPFRGKGMGTGVLSFDGGVLAVIYGVNPPDLKKHNFMELWEKHGGSRAELPFDVAPEQKKSPPRLKVDRSI